MTLRNGLIALLALSWCIGISIRADAVDSLVFLGVPTVKMSADHEGETREAVTGSDRNEFRVVIHKSDGTYRLTSRGGVELAYVGLQGMYHIFVHIGGFVKVLDASGKQAGIIPATYPDYVEVMHIQLGVLTYWGEAQSAISP